VEKRSNSDQETAKIGICTLLKFEIYFRFVSQTIGVEPTTFPNRVQNLVKICKELRTQLLVNRSVTDTHTHTDTRVKSD